MSLAHLFQDFGTLTASKTGKRLMSAEEIEDLKLQSFESGFQAGWEDAVKAQADTLTNVSAGLASSLQSASFEYHELRATLNTSVQSIMTEVIDAVLPEIARASLGAHIKDYIVSAARDALDRPIEITVAAESEEAVRQTLTSGLTEPFELVVDGDMSPNQALLRLGSKEAEIDLDKTVADIALAITTYFETQNPEVTDGGSA